jgi:hypothetical protein
MAWDPTLPHNRYCVKLANQSYANLIHVETCNDRTDSAVNMPGCHFDHLLLAVACYPLASVARQD